MGKTPPAAYAERVEVFIYYIKRSVEVYNVLPICVGDFFKSLISGLFWFSVYFGQ